MTWPIDSVENLFVGWRRRHRGETSRRAAAPAILGPLHSPIPQGAGKGLAAAGFTLIELAVVLVIIGLMLGLVLQHGPMRSPALQARAAAAQVAQGLRFARSRAIALNRPVTFSLDPADHSFRIDGAPPQALPPALQLGVLSVVSKASRQRNLAAISFAPDGSSSGGRIELAGNGVRLLVGVDWLTGLVSVADAR